MELKEGALAVMITSLILILLGLLTGGLIFYVAAVLTVLFLAADYYRLVIAMDDLRKCLDVDFGLSQNEIHLGASTQFICRLDYSGASSRTVLVRQKFEEALHADGGWKPVKISPGSSEYLTLVLRPSSGGTFTIQPPAIETESWLFRDSYTEGDACRLIVLLPIGSFAQRVGSPPPRMRRSMGVFNATVAKKGSGTDFSSIRKYELGDSMKRIDWVRSARMRDLMVRDYEDDQPLPALFIIDLAPSMEKNLNSAVGLTTVLFNKIHVNWEKIGLIAFSPEGVVQYLPPRIGSAQLHDMRVVLSVLKVSESKGDSRHDQETLPYELKSIFREGEAGLLVDEALREHVANIRNDGFSKAIMAALKALNTPSRIFVMTDLSMGMMSLVNNLRVAQYYGHKVSVVLMAQTWREDSRESSLETMQKLKAYGIEATVMGPEDLPEDVIRWGGMAGQTAGAGG